MSRRTSLAPLPATRGFHGGEVRRVVSQLPLGMVARVHYLSIWEAEARALPLVPGQRGRQSEIQEQTNKKAPISGDRKESSKCEDYGIGCFSSKMLEAKRMRKLNSGDGSGKSVPIALFLPAPARHNALFWPTWAFAQVAHICVQQQQQ